MNKEILNVKMEIICDTKINEHMHDEVICSQFFFIKRWMY